MATAAAGGGSDRLGENLMRDGLLTREQLAQALAEQKASKQRLGFVLVKLGLVPEIEITKILARQHRMPAVDLSRFDVDPKILKLVPADMATKGVVLPLKREGRTLTVAMADPSDLGLLEDLKFITRFDLFPVIAGEYTLRALIEKHYQSGNNQQELETLLKDMRCSALRDQLASRGRVLERAQQVVDRRRRRGEAVCRPGRRIPTCQNDGIGRPGQHDRIHGGAGDERKTEPIPGVGRGPAVAADGRNAPQQHQPEEHQAEAEKLFRAHARPESTRPVRQGWATADRSVAGGELQRALGRVG